MHAKIGLGSPGTGASTQNVGRAVGSAGVAGASVGSPAVGLGRLDTADLASILLPGATSYALQRLAADERIVPEAAHRALHDALTCAGVLAALARHARDLPPVILEECRAQSELLGPAYVAF